MRTIFSLALAMIVSTAALAADLNRAMGALIAHPEFMTLLTKATEEIKASERTNFYFLEAVHSEKQKALIHFLANVQGDLTEEGRAEIEVQAVALSKLRAEKNFTFDRLSVGSFEVSEKYDSISVVLMREDVHHYPPHFTAFKTVQADLKGGYGDFKLEISNIRFAK